VIRNLSHSIKSHEIISNFKKAFCSSISGALAARAMFESIGVGDDKATAYGATLTWLVKFFF
jgi:hypothetical protein